MVSSLVEFFNPRPIEETIYFIKFDNVLWPTKKRFEIPILKRPLHISG